MTSADRLELLSPAKNFEYGQAALNFGADAVYIGAPKFGARASAGNSLSEIEQLCRYAHRYEAKVLVAFNTVLFDSELAEAQKLIHQIYEAGADALIIQDMGILEMSLPPIPLHASTQAHNISWENILFLEKAGFSRVVLARELSLAQISLIRAKTTLELEAFVHGAVCVCYSGQCYLSAYMGNRSGNRGECAQPCRLPFTLSDPQQQILASGKNLLSLKDMNRAALIPQMTDAGVTSFKIEGRLKDLNYVKNVTAYYRKAIDAVLQQKPQYQPSSRGVFRFSFEPDPAKSFNRRFSSYFIQQRENNMVSVSPKATGQLLGPVKNASRDYFELQTLSKIHNGDGLCFFSSQDELLGFAVNKIHGERIYTPLSTQLKPGTLIYRNYDIEFDRQLAKMNQCRDIPVNLSLSSDKEGYRLHAQTPDGIYLADSNLITNKSPARETEKARDNIRQQLSKTGNTPFIVKELQIDFETPFFIPIPQINQLRREVLEKLEAKLGSHYRRKQRHITPNNSPFPQQSLDYQANVSNKLARKFYQRHGVQSISPAFETRNDREEKILMTTKYCLKFEMGICPLKQTPKTQSLRVPAYIRYQDQQFKLEYDCEHCQMHIRSQGKQSG